MCKTILYIAEMPAYHCEHEITAFMNSGYKVIVLSAWKDRRLFDDFKIESKLYFLHRNLWLSKIIRYIPPIYLLILALNPTWRRIKLYHSVDIIYTSWSSNVLLNGYYAKCYFGKPWIHRYLMYPISLDIRKNMLEQLLLKYVRGAITKLITHTKEMKGILLENGFDENKIAIHWERFPNSFFKGNNPTYSYEDLNIKPSLIFLGSLGGSGLNDIRELISNLEHVVNLWVIDSLKNRELLSNHVNVRFFPSQRVGNDLILHIQRYDGILACYNEKYANSTRINSVVPNRITLGIPARIPFVIPSNQLIGSRDLLKSLGLLVEFNSPDEIPSLLKKNHQYLKESPLRVSELMLNSTEVHTILDL